VGYYRPQRSSFVHSPISKTELVDRIEKVAARGVTTLTDWERKFLSSLLESAKKWGRLTAKQHEVYQRIEKKSDPKNVRAASDWREAFDPAKRAKAEFAARYYKANPPYFAQAADRIINDPGYIPSEKLYRKMVENRYVARAIENAASPPLYPAGSMAQIREGQNIKGRDAIRSRGKMVVIISVSSDSMSATKGARAYTVLPIGAAKPFLTEERYLKRAKKI
jgi:hypothetical protein